MPYIYRGVECVCCQCGIKFRTNPAYIRRRPNHRTFCSVSCCRLYKVTARMSEYTDKYGYEFINGGTTFRKRLHRYLMEQKLGRKLKRNEFVHHINGNKQDNRIENLELMTASEHSTLHGKMKEKHGVIAKCRVCGKEKYLPMAYIKARYKGNMDKCKNYRCRACI